LGIPLDSVKPDHALASTELSDESIEPVEPLMTDKLDITGLSEAELDALESALRKTALGMRQSN
jgi:hypothetical protein